MTRITEALSRTLFRTLDRIPGVPRMREDVDAMVRRDPAAKSALEVVLTYPGVHAVWSHRVAHRLWNGGHPLLARALSHVARLLTGVEIHPAAEVGRRVTIDHGMGVVVGETAAVGDDVHLLHGVTLGGTDDRPVKRHPTLGDGVTVGARATILGPVEVGEGATVGAGAVVTGDVPPGATAVGVPAEIRGVEREDDAADESEERAGSERADEEGVAVGDGDGVGGDGDGGGVGGDVAPDEAEADAGSGDEPRRPPRSIPDLPGDD